VTNDKKDSSIARKSQLVLNIETVKDLFGGQRKEVTRNNNQLKHISHTTGPMDSRVR